MFFRSRATLLLFAVSQMLLAACDESNLRGKWSKSADGKTYLAVVDDNGGGCGPIIVDGKRWPYKIGVPGPVAPGRHTIECGGSMAFDIPVGVTFQFNYWGP